MATFGKLIGKLIKQKRLAQGLTQTQLAEDAFGSSSKTRRISELESGSVSNPHLKTINPIIATLGISDAEIEICAAEAVSDGIDDLSQAYSQASGFIEEFAKQFEHDNSSASLIELDLFLREKAKEWRELRDRIATIETEEKAANDVILCANLALNEGRLADLDKALESLEASYQFKKTIIEVRKLSAIRIARGDAQLLASNEALSLKNYIDAAEMLRPFDEREAATTLSDTAHRIYEYSQRALKPMFSVAAHILEVYITFKCVTIDDDAISMAHYQLGLIYRNLYDFQKAQGDTSALLKGIYFSEIAANCILVQKNYYHFVTTNIGLANCLRDRGRDQKNIDDLKRGIKLLRLVEAKCKISSSIEKLMSHALNSRGALLLAYADFLPDTKAQETIDEALDVFRKSVIYSEKFQNTETWAAAKYNIGSILAHRTIEDSNANIDNRSNYIFAISELQCAIEGIQPDVFPHRLADAHRLIAQVFIRYALSLETAEEAEVYLFRSVQSLMISREVYSHHNNIADLARVNYLLAVAFENHSNIAELEIMLSDLFTAKEFIEEAEAAFSEHKMLDHHARALSLLNHISKRLEEAQTKQF